MDALWDIVVSVGHAIELVMVYVETHHWIFGFLAFGYIFYLHDKGIHARSMRSTSGSTKSGSASPSNIDGRPRRRPAEQLR